MLVIGGLVDYDWKNLTVGNHTITPTAWDFGARAGVLVNQNTLVYGLVTRPTLSVSGMSDQTGLGFGGGVETTLNNNFTVSLEYLRETYANLPTAREHDVMVRLNYKVHMFDNWFKQ
jgi:opacity protein-like surface antigen